MPRDIVVPTSGSPPTRCVRRRARVFRNLDLDVGIASGLDGTEVCRQMAGLLELEEGSREQGANLRPRADAIATDPQLQRWLDLSDAMTDRSAYAGPIELVSDRRKGVLRHLGGAEVGLPLGGPPALILGPDMEAFHGVLEDELEYHSLRVYRKSLTRPYRVPVKSLLNSKDARALLGWTWYRFERYFRTHTQEPTGRRGIHQSRGYVFDAEDFAHFIYKNSI